MIGELLVRLLSGLVRRVGVTTLLSLILLGLALGSIGRGLADMIHNLDTSPFWLVILGGVLFGWLLAKSPLPGWLSAPFALLFGAGVLFIQVGRLGNEFLTFLRTYIHLSWDIWQVTKTAPNNLYTVDTGPLSQAFQPLLNGFNALVLRAGHWLEAFTVGLGDFDPIAAALVWGLGLWIVSVWAAWIVRRTDRVFLGVIPAAGLYSFMLYYTGIGASAQTLVVMLGAILLLYALRIYVVNECSWQASKLEMVHSPWELGITAVCLTGVLMLAATLAPSLSVRQMVRMFDTLAAHRVGSSPSVAESLGLEVHPVPTTVFDEAKKATLPNQRLIGPGTQLSKRPVMHISVEGYDPLPQAEIGTTTPKIPPRYYWRSFTYDQYNGRGWYSSDVNIVDYPLNISDVPLADRNHQLVWQKVYPLVDLSGFVYTAGDFLRLDGTYQVAWRAEGDALAVQSDVKNYTAISSIPSVAEIELRSAGINYPEWVQQRYLRLPEQVPDRVRSLALDLTAVQPTPYDQALAIETYLRTISYTLDVPAPPMGRDVADYFLFDLQRGYCDYFATAMVVLARSVGIPARLVTGYASGGYDVFNAQFVVLEEDAHSWVEIYFPIYGWVEFEPTSSLPRIDYSGQARNPPPAYQQLSEPGAAAQVGEPWHRRIDLVFWVFTVLLVTSVGGLAWWGVKSWQLWRMPPERLVTHVYRWLYRQGRWFGLRNPPGQTAREFSGALILRIGSQTCTDRPMKAATQARRERLTSSINRDLYTLTLLYERSLFSAEPLDQHEKTKALAVWRSLGVYLRRAWWSGRWWVWLRGR